MKKIKRMLSAGLAVCCLGGLVFTAAADTFTNGAYFSQWFDYHTAKNLVNGTKKTQVAYSAVLLNESPPQSLYVKVASQSNGGGLDYCALTPVVRRNSTPVKLWCETVPSVGANIWLRAVNNNEASARYTGTGYLN